MTKDDPGSIVERFHPPRRLAEYRGQPGLEVGDQLLSPAAYQAIADAASSRQPCELVVTGEYRYPDGRRFLDLGVARDYLEATTNWRHRTHEDGTVDHALAWRCPDCGSWGDKHAKTCGS